MEKNTAELLQQMIDIKKDMRAAIGNKGVTVVSGMESYPSAIDSIQQEIISGGAPEIDFTQVGWSTTNSEEQNAKIVNYISEDIAYSQYMRDYYNYINNYGTSSYNTSVFMNDNKLVIAPFVNLNPSHTYYCFDGCESLRYVPLYDTSNSTNMSGMFRRCSALRTIPHFDTSKVTNMSDMLTNCVGLEYVPLLNCGAVESFSIFGHYPSDMFSIDKIEGFKDLGKSITKDYIAASSYKNVSFERVVLNRESLVNIINNLYDLNIDGKSLTLQLQNTSLKNLTDDDIAIATNKGWTVSV